MSNFFMSEGEVDDVRGGEVAEEEESDGLSVKNSYCLLLRCRRIELGAIFHNHQQQLTSPTHHSSQPWLSRLTSRLMFWLLTRTCRSPLSDLYSLRICSSFSYDSVCSKVNSGKRWRKWNSLRASSCRIKISQMVCSLIKTLFKGPTFPKIYCTMKLSYLLQLLLYFSRTQLIIRQLSDSRISLRSLCRYIQSCQLSCCSRRSLSWAFFWRSRMRGSTACFLRAQASLFSSYVFLVFKASRLAFLMQSWLTSSLNSLFLSSQQASLRIWNSSLAEGLLFRSGCLSFASLLKALLTWESVQSIVSSRTAQGSGTLLMSWLKIQFIYFVSMEGEHRSPATVDNDQRRKKRQQVRLKYAQINKGTLTPNEPSSRPQPSQHFPGAYPAESEIFTNSEESRDSSRNKRESLTRLKQKSKVLRQKFDSIKNNIDRQVNGDSPKRASPRVYAGRINRSLQNLNEPRLLKTLKTEEDFKIATPQSARKEETKRRYESRYSYRPNQVKLSKYNSGLDRARESGLNRLSCSAEQFIRAEPKTFQPKAQSRGSGLNLKQKLNLKFDYSKAQYYKQLNPTPLGQFQHRYALRPPNEINSYLYSQPHNYHFHQTDSFFPLNYRHAPSAYFDPKPNYQLNTNTNKPQNRFRIQLPERHSGLKYQVGQMGLIPDHYAGMSKGFALPGRDKMTLPVQQTSSIIIYSDEGQRAVKPRNLMWDLLDREKKHRPYHI